MQILSHRGYWITAEEKNTKVSFERSFSLSFGTETDLRDRDGELVVSHDPAKQDAVSILELFSTYRQYLLDLPLALNIKADGLQKLLAAALVEYQIKNYFVFDMSVPDMVSYIKSGIRVFTRQSEYEPNPVLYEHSQGVWIDGFKTEWIDESTIKKHIETGRQVCLVSPELHGRSHEIFWERLLKMSVTTSSDVMLCTDYPEQARKIFHG